TAIDAPRLRRLLAEAAARAAALGRPVLASLTQAVEAREPVGLFSAARQCGLQAFLWARPDADFSLVGADVCQTLESSGADRFAALRSAWRALLADALIDNPQAAPATGPVLGGGFSFDPEQAAAEQWRDYADASLVLPRLQLSSTAQGSYLTVNALVAPGQDTPLLARQLREQWRAILEACAAPAAAGAAPKLDFHDLPTEARWKDMVREAATAIGAGAMQKVVLAREVRANASAPLQLRQALERLRALYPSAYLFAVTRGARCFFGATPERLVRLDGGRVEVTALAGTCRRGISPDEDRLLGAMLLGSPKDRHEHALVVDALRATLDGLCLDLRVPAAPTLLQLKNVQHLYTPISGRLRGAACVLDLVAALHPTPAVGGLPRAAALEHLRRHEQLQRGWFAAPLGWIDAAGDGEFAVALRCALAGEREAALFAGCGIVADSDPDNEFAETVLKLRAMRYALGQEERRAAR
ncbi:isochorismate synthase, partial [Janthinobacterium sp.]|uniref:isochorismate synthase n=1 Tax=Janthinobacterium sp. TaxID=1871054 RepID=UPI00293D56AD